MKGVTIFIFISCLDEIFSVFTLLKNQIKTLNNSITYLIAVNCFPSGKWEGVRIWSPSPAMLPTAAHQNSSLKETTSFFNKLPKQRDSRHMHTRPRGDTFQASWDDGLKFSTWGASQRKCHKNAVLRTEKAFLLSTSCE